MEPNLNLWRSTNKLKFYTDEVSLHYSYSYVQFYVGNKGEHLKAWTQAGLVWFVSAPGLGWVAPRGGLV
jgi:hypothetical protein